MDWMIWSLLQDNEAPVSDSAHMSGIYLQFYDSFYGLPRI